MGKPVITRTLKLDFLGEDWKDCYIHYTRLSVPDVLAFSKAESEVDDTARAEVVYELAKNLMVDHFVDGVGYMGKDDSGNPIVEPLTVENISEDMFFDIYIPFIRALRGTEDTNL